jgi:MGT family glycosyltransferase
VVVREISEFAGCVAAERLDLPHAAVQISAFRPHLHRLIALPLNQLRSSVNLSADPNLDMLYRYLFLMTAPPRFHSAFTRLPPTAQTIQHVSFDRSGEEQLPEWIAHLPDRPTVYASLGTAYNRTPGVFNTILNGLRDEPINLVLTIGSDQNPADFGPQPPNVHIERYIPQSLLFAHCDLAVTHGGFGTIMTALNHALPMVVMPIAADQPDNAWQCSRIGVAEVVTADQRTPEVIRQAARTVLHDPRYRENAEQVRDEMRALPGPECAIELLEQLAIEKVPIVVDQ